MEPEIVKEVIACLPEGKTHFRYFKNGYAPRLLSMAVPNAATVYSIRSTAFGRLLDNPVMGDALARSGNGLITSATLGAIWHEPSLPYLLTVDRWRYESRWWSQVSRAGDNLVLQLNLPRQNQQLFNKFVGTNRRFNPHSFHPVQHPGDQQSFRETLAWARIDFSFETGEALIEEIQSDAVRQLAAMDRHVARCGCAGCLRRKRYLDWFAVHRKIWSEALLTATVEFIVRELGITQLFMHTARSGWRVKNMGPYQRPPRSLYAELPRKFAFRRIWNAPQFLLDTRRYQRLIRKQPDIDFHLLDFSQPVFDESRQKKEGLCHA